MKNGVVVKFRCHDFFTKISPNETFLC